MSVQAIIFVQTLPQDRCGMNTDCCRVILKHKISHILCTQYTISITITCTVHEKLAGLNSMQPRSVTKHGISYVYFSLQRTQVIILLDKMKLSQYKQRFMEEMVSGGLLIECDEDALKNDLQVTSRLHRVKFMLLINGKESAQKYFQL